MHEPTTETRLIVCLNVDTLGEGWWRGYDPDLLELAISTAASVAAWAVDQGRRSASTPTRPSRARPVRSRGRRAAIRPS